jgi:hypothetical protein
MQSNHFIVLYVTYFGILKYHHYVNSDRWQSYVNNDLFSKSQGSEKNTGQLFPQIFSVFMDESKNTIAKLMMCYIMCNHSKMTHASHPLLVSIRAKLLHFLQVR